ncbi:flagellar assembly protein H [Trinickia caryophylli]|uniref:Flagellar assembly protein FliH n=2 Tax=Trinickia caryophylli TaxID=28094 RepID=A0A1X7FH70_TRICW|nr:flagellar assembly protein FliH [Trinickia caryophylli]TRX19219.1 flagellar assembly protein FliH [Trinickia caryophylli]GLU33991.1 flagellar assembly protein H [Trinickia caryophylli]SMF52068.1 flagellar assembly protein FliH [Trinickia caryophylli]
MSDSGRPDKGQLSAYQRWEMASFDPPPPPDPVEENRLAVELQRLREEAHTQGLASGHVAGQALGYQAGFEQGHAQGFEKGRQEALAEAARLAALAESLKSAIDGVQSELSETLVALALDIAQQVVRQHIAHDPAALVACAREVLAAEPALTGAPQLVVHPADLPVVEAYLKDELEALGWSVRTDPAMERGGCHALAASGEIDASIGTRWERVAAAVGKVSKW